jgi:hypothetical protein
VRALVALAWPLVGAVAAQEPAPAAVDLATLIPPAVPAGFQPLPDQPGRLGPLDAPAAAGVLDQSGRVKGEQLTESGFKAGYAKAWSKPDTQEVIVDVLLEFDTERNARTFANGFRQGRRQTTTPFDLPTVPEASGFLRGPQTPTRTSPAQREVVLQRGRVMAIVVVAGFATYPPAEPAVTMAEAQRAALTALPASTERDDEKRSDAERAGAAGLPAVVLLVLVTWRLVAALREHPVVPQRGLPWA